MSDIKSMKLASIPIEQLIKFLSFKDDVLNEIIKRLEVSDSIQEDLDEAEYKLSDIETDIRDIVQQLEALI